MVLQNPNALLTTLLLTTKVTFLLVCTTRLGFPYSGDKNNLAPHRAFALHTEREFYNRQGDLKASDSGYWIVNLDRNSPGKLLDHVPEMYALEEVSPKQCEKFIFCGMPLYYPAHTLLPYNHWIPASKPNVYRKTSMELVTSEESGRHKRKLLFRVNGKGILCYLTKKVH